MPVQIQTIRERATTLVLFSKYFFDEHKEYKVVDKDWVGVYRKRKFINWVDETVFSIWNDGTIFISKEDSKTYLPAIQAMCKAFNERYPDFVFEITITEYY